MVKYSTKKEIEIKYNRKIWQINRRYKNELSKFDSWENVRKIAKPTTTVKRDRDIKCMKLAKQIVRKRDKCCQKCWSKTSLQCSHIISDARSTRLSVHPENMKLLCYKCHIHRRHKNPNEAQERLDEKRPWRYETLQQWMQEEEKGSISLEWWETMYQNLLSMSKKWDTEKQ